MSRLLCADARRCYQSPQEREAPENPKMPNSQIVLTRIVDNGDGTLIASDDNWRDTQQAEIVATGLQPTNDLESAIVATLPSSPSGIGYTAITQGVNGTTGIALVEFYALAP